MQKTLDIALKEWSLVCDALLSGAQSILLRKGGIYESAGEFELEHSQFLLYPTFAHQNPNMVKPAWRPFIQPCRQEPKVLSIAGWASVHWISLVPGRRAFDQLSDIHLWDKPLIDKRFSYRPDYPLYVLVLRAWRLPQPRELSVHEDYAGCRSWVPLQAPVAIDGSRPAGPPEAVEEIKERIRRVFGT